MTHPGPNAIQAPATERYGPTYGTHEWYKTGWDTHHDWLWYSYEQLADLSARWASSSDEQDYLRTSMLRKFDLRHLFQLCVDQDTCLIWLMEIGGIWTILQQMDRGRPHDEWGNSYNVKLCRIFQHFAEYVNYGIMQFQKQDKKWPASMRHDAYWSEYVRMCKMCIFPFRKDGDPTPDREPNEYYVHAWKREHMPPKFFVVDGTKSEVLCTTREAPIIFMDDLVNSGTIRHAQWCYVVQVGPEEVRTGERFLGKIYDLLHDFCTQKSWRKRRVDDVRWYDEPPVGERWRFPGRYPPGERNIAAVRFRDSEGDDPNDDVPPRGNDNQKKAF